MNHKFSKLALYFRNQKYWSLSNKDNCTIDTISGFFFLNLKDRLYDNHYDSFDEIGLPIRVVKGEKSYNYTTICSYALANWHLYLETGENKHTIALFQAIDFLFKNHTLTDYGGVVFPFKGKLSAMNQGEALSVLARGYELTNNEDYIEFAKKIIIPYEFSIKDYGVKGKFKELKNVYWYEEIAQIPHKHILNGMVYALNGLWEIYKVKPQLLNAKELFDQGINYIEKALPLFDTGKWSWYWIDEANPNYIASAMYHNLHCCQLRFLYSITGISTFKEYADKFENYDENHINKLLAGYSLLKGKIRMK